ncbi:hypothetical protein AgCh_037884 [Apium graveolens]
MVTDNLTWDVDLVRDMFNERDAELPTAFPLDLSYGLGIVLTTADGTEKWIKPEGDLIKINVDAALFREAEAMGLREALSWIKKKAWHRAVAETDNLTVVQSANSVAHFLARASYYVADRTLRTEDISPEFLDVILKDSEVVQTFLSSMFFLLTGDIELETPEIALPCLPTGDAVNLSNTEVSVSLTGVSKSNSP